MKMEKETVESVIALSSSKKEKIEKLSKLGKTNKEIAKLLGTNAGHVWNVLNPKKEKQDAIK